MANPLALYIPIKQDPQTQQQAVAAVQTFISTVQAALDASQIVHFALLTAIPNASGDGNQAVILHTSFDGPMNPYIEYFWNNAAMNAAFLSLVSLALTPADPPVVDLTSFANFVNSNNLAGNDLYSAYTKTVKQINGPA